MTTSSHFTIIIGIIVTYCWLLMLSPPADAQKISLVDSRTEVLVQGRRLMNPAPAVDDETSIIISTHARKSKRTRPRPLLRRRSHIETVHGIVNIIGWGILIPSGVINARYFKTNNSHDHELQRRFYSIHVVSQISGFILGSIGWGLGLIIRRQQSRNGSMSLHGIIGTIIFCLSAIQIMLGFRLMAAAIDRVTELMSKKLWRICHGVVGYVLIVLVIANIFEGINENLNLPSKKWNWGYGVILGAFSSVAIGLEVFRWIRFHEIDFV